MPFESMTSENQVFPRSLRRGDEIVVTMEKVADLGKSLTHHSGQVIFVPQTLVGEQVRTRITKRRKTYAEGQLLDLIAPSPNRVEPRCQHFGSCGGCTLQHVQYSQQLVDKQQLVIEAMARIAKQTDITVLPPIAAPKPYEYRNKMEFSFSTYRWLSHEEIASDKIIDASFALGLHPPKVFYKILDIDQCHLQEGQPNAIVNGIRSFAQDSKWKPWNWRSKEGFLRHLVIRKSTYLPDLMVNIVTSSFLKDRMSCLETFLKEHHPYVTTLVNSINSTAAQTAFGERTETIYGTGFLRDQIGNLTFQIAPDAFFQPNTLQAEQLVNVIQNLADFTQRDHIYDLYCGTGTIALSLAKHVKHVIGIDLVDDAINNAKNNSKINQINNCTFVSGDMLKLLNPKFTEEHGEPDIVILDPPRAGMHPKVAKQVAILNARKIIYVSCNVRTQARDLLILSEFYDPVIAQPIDLFPQTHHIENIVLLERKGHG